MTNRLTGLHRAWELWRRVARDVIVIGRHVVVYLVSRPRVRRATAAHHTRVAIEELGPTAIKLGQMLSTRNDVLPPAWQHELTRLQDAAPPVPPPAVRATIIEELGRPLHELFDSFVDAPLACASIGQAHAATLPGRTDVVVKVRRPGVVDEVELDLEVITGVVALISRSSRYVRSLDAMNLVEQFSTTLRHELDYAREANNVERFAANFAGDPDVRIPAVHHELSSARVLTLSLGHVLSSVLAVVRRHHLRFPSNLALLPKTLGMCEGLAAHLDPQFRMTEAITPYVAQLLASPPSDASTTTGRA